MSPIPYVPLFWGFLGYWLVSQPLLEGRHFRPISGVLHWHLSTSQAVPCSWPPCPRQPMPAACSLETKWPAQGFGILNNLHQLLQPVAFCRVPARNCKSPNQRGSLRWPSGRGDEANQRPNSETLLLNCWSVTIYKLGPNYVPKTWNRSYFICPPSPYHTCYLLTFIYTTVMPILSTMPTLSNAYVYFVTVF